jgi:hypothetical protein
VAVALVTVSLLLNVLYSLVVDIHGPLQPQSLWIWKWEAAALVQEALRCALDLIATKCRFDMSHVLYYPLRTRS